MPYQVRTYDPSQNARQISEIMGLPAQIQAQAAEARATAIARNASTRAAIAGQTGNLINSAGQQFVGNLADVMQLKREAPIRALQMENLQNQVAKDRIGLVSAQRAQQLHTTLSDAIKANTSTANGKPSIDHEGVIAYLQTHDAADVIDEYAKSASEIDKLLHPDEFKDSPSGIYSSRTGLSPKGEVVAPKPTPPTTASLAADAANANSPTHEQSAAALAKIQGPQSVGQAETNRHNIEMEKIGSMTAGRQAAASAEVARHNKAMEAANNPLAALQGNGSMTGSAAQAAQGVTGEDFLKQLPAPIASEVKAYAEGRRPFPAGFALKSPYFQSLIQMVGQYDPTFDAANYNARSKARTDLTSPNGTGGKTINALNTAIQHAGKLSDLIEKLDNYEYPLANAVVNPLRTAVGKTPVTNFNVVAPQLMKEIERAWRGTGGSAGEIQKLIDTMGANKGRQQQREALNEFVDLVEGKLNSTTTQRDNIMGPAAASIPVLFDQNKPILARIKERAASATTSTTSTIADGTEGTVNGQPAIWRQNGAQGAGWYAR